MSEIKFPRKNRTANIAALLILPGNAYGPMIMGKYIDAICAAGARRSSTEPETAPRRRRDLLRVAELTHAYSNFSLPPLHTFHNREEEPAPTLADQSAGLSKLLAATDAEPAETSWRSVRPYMDEVVQLYEAGYSLSAIEKKLGIAWDSVARLLDQAGVRERKNKSR
jgi:hypothetical protein